MNAFIKKNEKLLKFYSATLRISGWLLLVFSLCGSVIVIVLARNQGISVGTILITTPLSSFALTFLGLFGIGLAQLVRYLFDSNYKPGLILRYGDKFIYAYVGFTLIVATIHTANFIRYLRMSEQPAHLLFLSNSINAMVYFVAKALILIGMAQFLKRIMPVIEESKSLV